MNNEEFVSLLRSQVFESALNTTRQLLENPPGNSPSRSLVRISEWYRELSPEEKDLVKSVMRRTARSCVFSLLTLLDGVSLFPVEGKRGTFELYYIVEDQEVRVNDPEQEFLHDIFGSLVPPQ